SSASVFAANAERVPPAQYTTSGVARSGTRLSMFDSSCPRGMCTATGIAPCAYSSGSRTSSTTAPGRARRSSAVAVSISRICSFVARSKSRKLAIVDLSSGIPTGDPKTLPDRSTFRDSGAACEDAGAHANPAAHRALPRERRRGHHRRGGGPVLVRRAAPRAAPRGPGGGAQLGSGALAATVAAVGSAAGRRPGPDAGAGAAGSLRRRGGYEPRDL